ncbi:MAG: hypothetical protein AMXMBFR47_15800 [Planctomycetota bacterium]
MALIQIRDLRKYYVMGDSVVRALDGVDLDIAAGEFVAITGPSGSGKSTMMHLLGCLDRPNSGSYCLNGVDVSNLDDRRLAQIRNREIGFVFQTFNLINRTTALDNVGVPLFYARRADWVKTAQGALDRVGLGHRSSHRPNELSGGERQRVAIARAIVNTPHFVLADEPTGNLDSRTGEQIMEIFHDLNRQGVTIVLVTHEPDVAMQARRIVQMRDGKIVADRQTADILREQGGMSATQAYAAAMLTPPSAAPPAAPSTAVSGADQPGSAPGAVATAVARPVQTAADSPAAAIPAAATPAAYDPEALLSTPKSVAPGAWSSLGLGILALLVFLSAFVYSGMSTYFAAKATGRPIPEVMQEFQQNPPPWMAGVQTTMLVIMAVSVIPGIFAIRLGSRAAGLVRRDGLRWTGSGRANWGRVLGWIPTALVALSLLLKLAGTVLKAFR